MRRLATSLLFILAPLCTSLADEPSLIIGQVKAVGVVGASAVAQVGFFHPGGPIHDKPAFAAFTEAGRVIDKDRVLVVSSSNFGAPRAIPDAPEGAVLSLDLGGPTLVIPPDFAAAGNQVSIADGRIQLFAAQSPAFVNSLHTPGAASAKYPTVSNPLGISINNAFGRLWFANAPLGADGTGTESIADPTGEPLAGAPSHDMGPALTDNVIQGSADGADWRTTPLWGVGTRERLLHDGRATNLREAIMAHGGEATVAADGFRQLSGEDQNAPLHFLSTL